MIKLETTYMGLNLKNPIIAGSSGLTNSVENIIELERQGVGAVVLKSLFEEQIAYNIDKTINQEELNKAYPEANDYISNYTLANDIEKYLQLIKQAKEKVKIPIIASINCFSTGSWTSFAKKIENAGADALELNIFVLPSDPKKTSKDNESIYLEIIQQIQKEISIPLSVKLSYYFSALSNTLLKMSWTGINGLVLFNRFFSPDIDINKLEIKATNVFSSKAELSNSLRWVAMLSDRVECDIAASTGIHDGSAIIKQLLAGAKVVQIASTLYKNGFKQIPKMIEFIENWMKEHKFENIEDFRGKMSIKEAKNPAAYERVQFMKHFSGIE
ncbi:MAG: dihydroorotate dehydrogenase-like protein [Bacteroidales bacterium]